jgi:2-oxoglutarate ferredoxin oxidoreductase subunit beta
MEEGAEVGLEDAASWKEIASHPMDELLRAERLPHIWCPGCGLGTALSCFSSALLRSELDLDKVSIVSGIGCTGRVAGYLRLDGFHTTHGRALPFATGLKLANDSLKVIVFSGDGDLIAIGGNHFIHAARRNMDITVICANNFIYGMTGGQVGPTTPTGASASTSPWGNLEHPFNVPNLAAAAGATYVARWTALHARRLERSIYRALLKPGFTVVEVISPCPTAFGRANREAYGRDMMRFYHENAVIRHGAHPEDVDIGLGGEIICGEFVDIERPTFQDRLRSLHHEKALIEYKPWAKLDLESRIDPERAIAYRTPLDLEPVGTGDEDGAVHARVDGLPLEVRFGGFGGQGIILSGTIMGRAQAIYEERQVSLTRSYGPEARGGACSSALVISDRAILYPHVTRPGLMIMMSQAAYARYHDELAEDGLLLVDADLVNLEPDAHGDKRRSQDVIRVPATHIAGEELGLRIVANIVMLGAVTALTDVTSREAMRKAVLDSVPEGTEELNEKAFDRGYEVGMELLEERNEGRDGDASHREDAMGDHDA